MEDKKISLNEQCLRWLGKIPKAPFVVMALFLLLSCLQAKPRLLELTTHFKLQYFVGACCFTMLYALIRAWRWMAAALCGVLMSGASFTGFYVKPATALSVRAEKRVRLLLANVLWESDAYQRAVDLVKLEQPDIVLFQEFTPEWENGTRVLRDVYAYGLADTRGGAGGNAILSRWPVKTAEVIDVGNYLSPTIEVVVPFGKRSLTLVTAHPHVPSHDGYGYRNIQLQQLVQHLGALTGPKMLMGDLNTTMWSPYFHELETQAGLRNARDGFGILPTWPQKGQWPMFRIPLDHCLVSPEIRVEAFRVGSNIGSDHLPIIVDVTIPE